MLIITRSDCERVVKSKLYKEVTCELMQEIVSKSGERVIKSDIHKEVTQKSVHRDKLYL